MKSSKTTIDYTLVNDIYHSESPYEMKVKADMLGVDLNNIDVLKFLVKTTTYHAAFYPHTKKRFKSLVWLLKNDSALTESHTTNFIDWINKQITDLRNETSLSYLVPGAFQELRNYQIVFKAITNEA